MNSIHFHFIKQKKNDRGKFCIIRGQFYFIDELFFSLVSYSNN